MQTIAVRHCEKTMSSLKRKIIKPLLHPFQSRISHFFTVQTGSRKRIFTLPTHVTSSTLWVTQPTIAFTDCRYRKRKSVVQIFLTSSVFFPPLHGVNAVKRKEESRAGNKKMTYSTIVLYSSMFSVEILIDSFTSLFHRGGLRTVVPHKNCIDKF